MWEIKNIKAIQGEMQENKQVYMYSYSTCTYDFLSIAITKVEQDYW